MPRPFPGSPHGEAARGGARGQQQPQGNNLTGQLSLRDPLAVAQWKTLGAGVCSLLLSVPLGGSIPTLAVASQALALGAVDQDVDPKEQSVLAELATRLGFDGEREQELRTLARDLEPPVDGDTSWAKRLVTLFKAIPTRLESSTLDAIDVAFEHE